MGRLACEKLEPRGASEADGIAAEALRLLREGDAAGALTVLRRRTGAVRQHSFACYLAGLAHSTLGDYRRALQWYERAVRLEAGYADAHYGRALMLQQLGRAEEALGAYDEAFRLGLNTADAIYNRGAALLQLGRGEEALAAFAQATVLSPAYVPALAARAQVLEDLGRHVEAISVYTQLLEASPQDATVWYNCSAALAAQGEAQGALEGYLVALQLRPGYGKALYGAASALKQLGRADEALKFCAMCLEQTPDDVEALILQANLLHEAGRADEALPALDRALKAAPEDARALCNKGLALHALGRLEDSASFLDAAIARQPDFIEAWLGRGNLDLKCGRLDEALACFERAMGIDPRYAKAVCGRALVLREMGRFEEAAASFEQTLALNPRLADAHANYSALQLLLGDFERGWEGYEYRYMIGEKAKAELTFPWPEWTGEPLDGKSIAVLDEAGAGDVFMLARYLPLLAGMGARVTFRCRPSMHAVLGALRPAVALEPDCEGGTFDCCIPLFSLPRVFRTRVDTVPASVPYLRPDPARAAAWAARIGGHGFRIGINWQGNPDPRVDMARSAPLAAFAPLAGVEGVRLISLQKHSGVEQLGNAGFPVETLGEDFDSGPDAFMDTAAVMANLDLVITVDTSIAHLAGALGRPVWVALKLVPEWRWMLERDDTPWYPSMRLYRQRTRGNWDEVFARMAGEVQAKLSR